MTWVPESCTLPSAEQPLRVAEFARLLASAAGPPERPEPTRLVLPLPADDALLAAVRDLAARESACCSFFAFDLRHTATGAELEVRVPPDRAAVLDALATRS